ncbi:hypothetical protein, partial [Escherichia coli]|uniref:hypothetical protein n=1 Tax=Escherichia coli TaxID=562 RepID=UPI0018D217AC
VGFRGFVFPGGGQKGFYEEGKGGPGGREGEEEQQRSNDSDKNNRQYYQTLAKKLAIAVLDRQRTFQYSHGFSQPPLARRIEHIAHLRIA